MAHLRDRAVIGELQVLFAAGAIGERSDAELLTRFAARNADAEIAFEVLVRRHGPMVLRVCRSVLGDLHDAQDAFQATFLVLARKAGSLRRGDSLASWLHEVARRVAWRARAESCRHRVLERIGAELTAGRRVAQVPHESFELHDELSRLPEKYRLPLVLCYLEGLTHEEAASRLGWPVGTVRSRLARGRDALRIRLNSGDIAAPAALLTLSSGAAGRAETVPTTLTYSTIRAVMAPITATTNAITLMKGAIATMTRTQLIKAVTLALSAGLIAAAATRAYSPVVAIDDPPKAREDPVKADLDKLQGKWYRVASEADGRDWMPKGSFDPANPGLMVIFEGEKWRGVGADGNTIETHHTITLKPKKMPKQMILGFDQGNRKGAYQCIYKIKDDTLMLCIQFNVDEGAPTDFTTKPGDGRVLDVYKRAAPQG